MEVLRLLLALLLSDIAPYTFPTQPRPQPTYDFVVVGAGAAGSVVGGRLAEWGAEVLLLEAGNSAPPESAVPGLMAMGIGGDLDWHLRLEPQTNSLLGYQGNASYISLGRVVGGGSTIGGMLYTRGSRRDYDHWAALGNTGWSYKDVLPYFKKSEHYLGDPQYHGQGGPLRVLDKPLHSEVGRSFLRAGQELGYSIIDENAGDEIGFSPLQFTIHDGVRESTSERFLRPYATAGKLRVMPHTLVTKIIFDNHKRAVGVQYEFGKEKKKRLTVHARKEVIVCAGAINSPKLLLLSGVGPEEHLRKVGVPVEVPLPGVGHNLQDHHGTLNLPFAVKNGAAFNLKRFFSLSNLKQYVHDRTGAFALPFGEDGGAWLRLGGGPGPQDWPDVQLSLLNLAVSSFGSVAAAYNSGLKKEVYNDLFAPVEGGEAMVIAPILARPRSTGTVTLRSSRARDAPVIRGNYLDHPDDVALFVKAVRLAQAVAATRAMTDGVDAVYKSKPLRGCTSHIPDSDQYWECFARYTVTSFWHPSGTCKMAPSSDPMGVVSPTLHVRGTQGLRVVDASVFPQTPIANVMAAAIMVGERAADFIRQEWAL